VRGFASDPENAFESTPPLPEGEVLPRVLFDKSQQGLTSSEAINLSLGVATLLDGSGGRLDQLRAATGLDVLSIDAGADNESLEVVVGRNVADGVFVGAKQPIDGGPASVTVEIDVFDNVTVDSEVSSQSGSSVGLNWKKDF
jgi:translocation and assembly module TamB